MGNMTTISTTIPVDIYHEVKKKGYKWNDLIITGLKSKDGLGLEKEQNERLKELEIGNDRLQRKLSQIFGELEMLRDKK